MAYRLGPRTGDESMSFSSFNEFLAMGGHGVYVWSSYAIALVVLGLNILLPLRQRKRVLIEHARYIRREENNASDS